MHSQAYRTFKNFLFFVISCALFLSASAIQNPVHANNKYASIVIDSDTGMVLSRRNADKILHPASLTKMMTMLMVFDAIKSGRAKKSDRIRISHFAANMQPSKIGLPAGSSIRVDDALKALATKSANDIAVAVAEHIGGSEQNFARMMTARAQHFGMNKTRFVNASGLHDPRQVSTARDMARLSRILIHHYQDFYHYFSLKSFTYRGKTYKTHNKLMHTYKGMDGLKTGYILASGFNLAASAKRDGRRIIGVVFGGRTGKSRNKHMQMLLDKGFTKLKRVPRRATPRVVMGYVPKPAIKPQRHQAPARIAAAEAASNIVIPSDKPLLDQIEPAAGLIINKAQSSVLAAINTSMDARRQNILANIMGQGDLDEESIERFRSGLMAIAAHSGKEYEIEGIGRYGHQKVQDFSHSLSLASKEGGNWAVQVGAFKSRAQTDQSLKQARDALPKELLFADARIVPATINGEIMFRGRLVGYNKENANKICAILKDCMVIAPVQ